MAVESYMPISHVVSHLSDGEHDSFREAVSILRALPVPEARTVRRVLVLEALNREAFEVEIDVPREPARDLMRREAYKVAEVERVLHSLPIRERENVRRALLIASLDELLSWDDGPRERDVLPADYPRTHAEAHGLEKKRGRFERESSEPDPHRGKTFSDFLPGGVAPVLAALLSLVVLAGCDAGGPSGSGELVGVEVSAEPPAVGAWVGEPITFAGAPVSAGAPLPRREMSVRAGCIQPDSSERIEWHSDGTPLPVTFNCTFEEIGEGRAWAEYSYSGRTVTDTLSLPVEERDDETAPDDPCEGPGCGFGS